MTDTTRSTPEYLTPLDCLRLFLEHRKYWIVPTVVCAILSFVYALFMTRYWEASQGLVVRDEASTSSVKSPGKFADLYEMRTFQETVLEVAKSHQVLAGTLQLVDGQGAQVPSDRDIEILRKRLSMTPPNGAEFGKTEVFYLGVKDPDRQRAVQLVSALCDQLAERLGDIRNERSHSLIDELQRQVDLAQQKHNKVNESLEEFEAAVGTDLGELRLLHSATGGQSDLRQQMVEVEQEKRRTDARIKEAEELMEVLKAAQQSPEKLVAVPSSLLSFQPTLQRLKDGLVDSQLQVTRLAGTRTADHPQVKAARESVKRARQELHSELDVALEGLQIELDLSRSRMKVLQSQLQEFEGRLNRLAALRAEYSSRVAAAETSRGILGQLQRELGEAQSQQVAALSSSLVTPLDKPETGSHPVGIGRTTVLLMGTIAGFGLGLGWLFLHVAVPTSGLNTGAPIEAPMPPTSTIIESPEYTPQPNLERIASARPVRPAATVAPAKFDFSCFTNAAKNVCVEAGTALAGLAQSGGLAFPPQTSPQTNGIKRPVSSRQD